MAHRIDDEGDLGEEAGDSHRSNRGAVLEEQLVWPHADHRHGREDDAELVSEPVARPHHRQGGDADSGGGGDDRQDLGVRVWFDTCERRPDLDQVEGDQAQHATDHQASRLRPPITLCVCDVVLDRVHDILPYSYEQVRLTPYVPKGTVVKRQVKMAKATTRKTQASRRGRPRKGEEGENRRRVLDAAFAELVERGYERVTMLGIASRAGSSKETLYSWFGNREGLFAALIQENADRSAQRVEQALRVDDDHIATLTSYATGLLTLLTDERSVALNRAAMSSPELARVLLESGRHRVGPLVEEYLARLSDVGHLRIAHPPSAFGLLYGLVIQDTQIRVLLGEPAPTKHEIDTRAAQAVAHFLELTQKR